ncbi:hypothetical protein [Cerasicoccus fimbriatus]|uniref:hypothetical protein n=1 Tax=Cerasicoccus fimbriatus TaxID=3014554 RepID=UPI0022B515AF|nr:hypothetical protein [Cerasicoccus sp. TK19100]
MFWLAAAGAVNHLLIFNVIYMVNDSWPHPITTMYAVLMLIFLFFATVFTLYASLASLLGLLLMLMIPAIRPHERSNQSSSFFEGDLKKSINLTNLLALIIFAGCLFGSYWYFFLTE